MNKLIIVFPQVIIAIALCIPRMLAAFAVAPFFSPQYVTGLTRSCISVSFALIIFPIVFPSVGDRSITMLTFLGIIAKESIVGAALGFVVGLFFWGIQAIGSLLDHQRGAGVAESYDPMFGSQASPLSNFLMSLSMLLFFSAGGFLIFLSALYESYLVWPILSYLPKPDMNVARFSLEKIDDLMEMIVLLASPILIVMFLSDLGLGLINRFAPQLNVFFLTMPIKSALCILLLILYLPHLISYLKKFLAQNADVLNLLKIVMQ